MVDDFRRGVTQCDATHIDEFVQGVDWAEFSPATPPGEEHSARNALAATFHRSVSAGLEINIHFHTFELASAVALIEAGNREAIWDGAIDVVETVDEFPGSNPNGFLIVARVRKPTGARLRARWSRKGLRPDARRLSAE